MFHRGGNSADDFYSHAREGRDLVGEITKPISQISTHTPARGVTAANQIATENGLNFYSHAREGRDAESILYYNDATNFYSHAREGRDE